MSGADMQKYKFEKLEVYILAERLIVEIYQLLKQLPKDELFGLTAQTKRAIISVALNIAEGSTTRSDKDFARFIGISIGSLIETRAALMIAIKLKFIEINELEKIAPIFDELFFKLLALKKSLNDSA